MLRRAIEASMADSSASGPVSAVGQSTGGAVVVDEDDEEMAKALAASLIDNGSIGDEQVEAQTTTTSGQGEEAEFVEDAPTVDELRLKRLARFGAM